MPKNIIDSIDTFCSEYEQGQDNRYKPTIFIFECFAKSLGIDVNYTNEKRNTLIFEFYKNGFTIVTKNIKVTD